MTFDLATAPQSREVDLAVGVTATLRPWTGALAAAADSTTEAELDLIQRGGGLERFGIEMADWPEDGGAELLTGLAYFVALSVRAGMHIEAWNLEEEDGEPRPISTLTVSRLFWRGVTGSSGPDHMAAYAAGAS